MVDSELTEEVKSNGKVKPNPNAYQEVGKSIQLSTASRKMSTCSQERTFQEQTAANGTEEDEQIGENYHIHVNIGIFSQSQNKYDY